MQTSLCWLKTFLKLSCSASSSISNGKKTRNIQIVVEKNQIWGSDTFRCFSFLPVEPRSSFLLSSVPPRWRDVVAVRRQLKRQMRGFPAAPCCVDPRFKLQALAPSAPARPSMADLARGLVNLGNAGTLTLSSTR